MTVGELREALDEYEDGDEVVLSSDAEGNGFKRLSQCTPETFDDDENELVYSVDGVACMVLWPWD